MALDEKSLKMLEGVNEDLVKVAVRAHEMCAAEGLNFIVIEGLRTMARQRMLVASGASKLMNSYHLTGEAFDFAPLAAGAVTWKWPAFWPIVEKMEAAAKELGVQIECGARWKKFPDGPHVQKKRVKQQ